MDDKKMNPVGWFEIPVKEMDRAMKFYNEVFGYELEKHDMEGGMKMAWFPMHMEGQGAAGSLVQHEEWYKVASHGTEGTLVYFTSPSGDLTNELSKVEAAGGRIIKEKYDIGEHGFIGMFLDSEGNRVAIHSMQ